MDITYDCEFIEDGEMIALLSIGMTAEDGRELYLVSRDAPLERIVKHPWLMEHVVPWLPLACTPAGDLTWNTLHPDFGAVAWLYEIRDQVADFVLSTPQPRLWGWYSAYDHVAICQLFGTMADLPEGFPMWTNDIRQECERLGNPPLPAQDGPEHHALADACHNQAMLAAIRDYETRCSAPDRARALHALAAQLDTEADQDPAGPHAAGLLKAAAIIRHATDPTPDAAGDNQQETHAA